ncbi:MAG: Gfo/Idh/MocA family oxidoreductase [Nibricoccus sp.]
MKLKMLIDSGFFGKILSVRGEFGYWVFEGDLQPAQRPSWNYRKEDGGGMIIDMLCHWRYVIDNLFGNVKSVSCLARHAHRRAHRRSRANRYKCTADDSAYATFETDQASFSISTPRGPSASAATTSSRFRSTAPKAPPSPALRDFWTQRAENTPRPVWNPDIAQPINFFEGWQKGPRVRRTSTTRSRSSGSSS